MNRCADTRRRAKIFLDTRVPVTQVYYVSNTGRKKKELNFELLLLFQVLHGAHVVLLFAFLDLPGGLYFSYLKKT